ncbi:MAG: prepilin-type N-terminal cleavage/methylation domain-containing protein [Patescibacteria group bacterium]
MKLMRLKTNPLQAKSYLPDGKAGNLKATHGFTLIELLVVIAIISLLSSIILASLGAARSKARDSKRIQDLRQVQNALELYKADNGRYPDDSSTLDVPLGLGGTGMDCWDCADGSVGVGEYFRDSTRLGPLSSYLNPRPSDPSAPLNGFGDGDARGYWYKSDPNGQDYKVLIYNTIENTNAIPQNMIDTYIDPFGDPDTILVRDNSMSIWSSDWSKTWETFTCEFSGGFGSC